MSSTERTANSAIAATVLLLKTFRTAAMILMSGTVLGVRTTVSTALLV